MYATFSADNTVELLQAAKGKADDLRAAVERVRRERWWASVVTADQVTEALRKIEAEKTNAPPVAA